MFDVITILAIITIAIGGIMALAGMGGIGMQIMIICAFAIGIWIFAQMFIPFYKMDLF